jgi:uncharacterized protein (DUF2164 family)
MIISKSKRYNMKLTDIIEALRKLIKPENTTTEDVFYNAGVIDCIKEIEKQAYKKELNNKQGK